MIDQLVAHSVIGSLCVYLCVGYSWRKAKLLRYATAWLVVAGLVYLEVPWDQTNFYNMMEIPVKATKHEVASAFRQASKKYHPDKIGDSPAATEAFLRLKKAHETLSHEAKRSNYNRFGDYRDGDVDEKSAMMVVSLSLVMQLLCFIVGYFCSFPSSIRFARQIFVIYNVGCFCLELQFRFIDEDQLFGWVPWFGTLLPFEKVRFLCGLFPSVLSMSCIWATYLFIDQEAKTMFLLRNILSSNRVLCERMQDVIRCTAYVKSCISPSAEVLQAKIDGIESAALRLKLNGVQQIKLKEEQSTATDTSTVDPISSISECTTMDSRPASPPWEEFAKSLNAEQLAMLSKLTLKGEEKHGSPGGSVSWTQLFFLGGAIYLWTLYK